MLLIQLILNYKDFVLFLFYYIAKKLAIGHVLCEKEKTFLRLNYFVKMNQIFMAGCA